MPDSPPPGPKAVGDIIDQLQAGASATAEAAQALDQAAQTATEIATDIRSADVPVPAKPPSGSDASVAAPSASHIPAPVPARAPLSPELHRLLSIEVPIIVQLGTRRMSVGEVIRFAVGAIVEFQKGADDELELLASNKAIGKGHAVKVGENFGIKLSSIGSVREVIQKLGGTA